MHKISGLKTKLLDIINWEYWPTWAVYFFVYPFIGLQMLRFHRQNFDLKGEDNCVLANGEKYLLSIIGNHIQGAIFRDASKLSNSLVEEQFDNISKGLGAIYCVRYDLKAHSKDEFQKGKFKIVEVNGVGAEPTHMYDLSYSYLKGQSILFKHWRTISKICLQSKRLGNNIPNSSEGKAWEQEVKRYQSAIS